MPVGVSGSRRASAPMLGATGEEGVRRRCPAVGQTWGNSPPRDPITGRVMARHSPAVLPTLGLGPWKLFGTVDCAPPRGRRGAALTGALTARPWHRPSGSARASVDVRPRLWPSTVGDGRHQRHTRTGETAAGGPRPKRPAAQPSPQGERPGESPSDVPANLPRKRKGRATPAGTPAWVGR